jgi:hypothetical protein
MSKPLSEDRQNLIRRLVMMRTPLREIERLSGVDLKKVRDFIRTSGCAPHADREITISLHPATAAFYQACADRRSLHRSDSGKPLPSDLADLLAAVLEGARRHCSISQLIDHDHGEPWDHDVVLDLMSMDEQ